MPLKNLKRPIAPKELAIMTDDKIKKPDIQVPEREEIKNPSPKKPEIKQPEPKPQIKQPEDPKPKIKL
mgnify:CR=1 FL=1